MQLLTLAGSFVLIACSVVVSGVDRPTDTIGPCEKAKLIAEQTPGVHVPQCTAFGFFKPRQCQQGSMFRCWCVNPETGKDMTDNKMIKFGADCTICHIARAETLRADQTKIMIMSPVCDAEGYFKSAQEWEQIGQRWCVDRYTGKEVEDTRTSINSKIFVPCDKIVEASEIAMKEALETKGPCYAKMYAERGREEMPGFNTPSCTSNGYYKTEQFHLGYGLTWCANPETGAEVADSRRASNEKRRGCGVCFKDIEEKLSRNLRIQLPRCNDVGEYASA